MADAVLDGLSHFQNAIHAPPLGHPVEAGKVSGGDFNFRKGASAFVNTTKPYIGGGHCTVIDGDFAHDFRREIAQFPLYNAVLSGEALEQAVVFNGVLLCVLRGLGQ